MPSTIFVNLAVKDLAAATSFYEAIGPGKNEQLSDQRAASMVWSDAITFQLLTREYFTTLAPKQVAAGDLVGAASDTTGRTHGFVARRSGRSSE